jgi:ApaG protein
MSELHPIEIKVMPEYLPEHSDPDNERFVFAYHIMIRNSGNKPARLISRHWIITDGNGKVDEVRGMGVVGEQPLIASGEDYDYSSVCVLETPVGTMQGSYQMAGENDATFDAIIPAFTLAVPGMLN